MVAMGKAIWLMARLCGTTLRHPLVDRHRHLVLEHRCVIGVTAILMGYRTGYDWFEFPPLSAVVLSSLCVIMSWAVMMFRFRRGDQFTSRHGICSVNFFVPVALRPPPRQCFSSFQSKAVMQAAVAGGTRIISSSLLGAIALGTAYN